MGQVAENVKSVLTLSLEASADIDAYQWHLMKMSADGEVTVCSAVTDVPIGVLTNKPGADGREAQILVVGVCPVVIGTGVTLTYASLITTDTSGEAAVWTPASSTTAYVAGRCIRGGAAGEKGVCVINCGSNVRGDC